MWGLMVNLFVIQFGRLGKVVMINLITRYYFICLIKI